MPFIFTFSSRSFFREDFHCIEFCSSLLAAVACFRSCNLPWKEIRYLKWGLLISSKNNPRLFHPSTLFHSFILVPLLFLIILQGKTITKGELDVQKTGNEGTQLRNFGSVELIMRRPALSKENPALIPNLRTVSIILCLTATSVQITLYFCPWLKVGLLRMYFRPITSSISGSSTARVVLSN